eukprot:CAMPEP_0181221048 /NCGR_PEP_ID=MMETSP1096-20121128/29174_1 /TAXON_ID=156174 ORGANISM="Chrysochromulina ericina, Strain CCMP281" /NCGR_SAMPLE_ID=MMETSP1096 /ASSEMBLY_ACC=CAM_ASM_000453 /LENGTH=41 /DNA_ID= /DNA_START= /DNA_END= /DNA_ORIENTATION=
MAHVAVVELAASLEGMEGYVLSPTAAIVGAKAQVVGSAMVA